MTLVHQHFVAALAAIELGLVALALGCGHESVASPTRAAPTIAQSAKPAAEPKAASDNEAKETAAAEPAPGASAEPPKDDANPPPKPAGKRPPADRTPRRPGEAEKITFEDLILGMQADIVFRPFMLTDRAKELDGQRVSITGYMHQAQLSQRGVTEFVLLRNTECKFGPGGQADHLAQVYLRKGETTSAKPDAMKVEGTLKIEPYVGPDQNTWAIYRLEDALVK